MMAEATSSYLNRPLRTYDEARRDIGARHREPAPNILNRPLRNYLGARRDRECADRLHYRIQARNTADAIRSERHDLAVIDSHWPECPAGIKARRRQNIETWLRFLGELRALHTASIRYVRGKAKE